MKLCSACLLGIRCRYDSKNRLNKKVVELTEQSGYFFGFSTAHPEEQSDEGSHEILQLFGLQDEPSGKNRKKNSPRAQLTKKDILIPVCPEQLGGLPTPREPSEQKDGRAFTKSGKDITRNLKIGAEEVLRLAKLLSIKEAIFKQRSPSCGCGQIYDGTFSGKIIKGDGITTALLKKNNIKVISEEEY